MYLELGSAPTNEDCAQVGRPDYYEQMTKETSALIRQLKRMFPNVKCRFVVKSFPHDFGTYHVVVAKYNDPESFNDALTVENEFPQQWDEIARQELAIA